jgi:hypothetical protein
MATAEMRRWARGLSWSVALAFALPCALAAPPARADGTADARAAAQVLFDQGKDLAKAGKFAEACPKFEESQKLDPRIGTQFKLADCFEHIGRTASAWTNFVDVASATKAAGQADREQVARDRAATLEKRLSRLTIRVDGASADLRVKRDETDVGQALWGTPVPIDPGDHLISASAPGKKAWQETVKVGSNAASLVVTVPALIEDPTAVVAPPPPLPGPAAPGAPFAPPPRVEPEGPSGTGQRIAGGVVMGVGAVGIALGTVFGLQAKSRFDQSKPLCRTEALCSQPGLDLVSQAKGSATVSTIGFIVGGAALAGGLVVILTAPSGHARASASFSPLVGPQVAGGALSGAF